MTVREAHSHNLPPQLTPFVGRQSEITDIVNRLQDKNCRLLTLVGSGGIGKTRLAVESIQHLIQSNFQHGVFYVPLAPLTLAENIVTTIINVLGILIGDEGTPQEELVKFLSQRNLLLVMDNFEHILAGAEIVTDILNSATNVKILVTSRETLNLRMEHVWQVHGMRYPDSQEPEDINQYDALNLFIERALQIRRDFSLGDEQLAVVQICQLLDGHPLAIELAAGWLKMLSCDEIIKQMERGIDFLATRNRDIPDRHRSMRAVFDHSWDLLSADEQDVFPRLSVFRGGFTLDAAEHVADADLLTLSGLVEKSMVRRDANDRYDVHELMRQFAEEELKQADEFETVHLAHMQYFAEFIVWRTPDLKGRRQNDSIHEIDVDFGNVRDAWQFSISIQAYTILDKMLEAIDVYAELVGMPTLAHDLLKSVELATIEDQGMIDQAVVNRLLLQKMLHNPESRLNDSFLIKLRHHIIVAKEHNDLRTIACCYFELADYHYHYTQSTKSDLTDNYLETSIQHYRKIGDDFHLANALFLLSLTYELIHDLVQAEQTSQETFKLRRKIGDQLGLAKSSRQLSSIYENIGDGDKSLQYIRQAIQIFEKSNNVRWLTDSKMVLAEASFFRGDFREIKTLAKDVMRYADIIDLVMPLAMWSIGYSMEDEDYERGLELAQASYAEYIKLQSISGKATMHFAFAIAATGIGDHQLARHHHLTALAMYPKADRTQVVSLTLRAIELVHQKNTEVAVEYLGLVTTLPEIASRWTTKWGLLRRLDADLKAELGESIYQTAWERGTQFNLEETVAKLLDFFTNADASPPPSNQKLIEPLTNRELEILPLLGDGLTNQQIADELIVSLGTVKSHMYNIYQKLGVKNRTQALIRAKDLGLI